MTDTLKARLEAFYMAYGRHWLSTVLFNIPGQLSFYRLLRRLGIFPSLVARALRFHGVFDFPVEGKKISMRSHGEHIEASLFWGGLLGGWEKISLGLWCQLCRDANVILDLGANTGIYSLIAKSINPAAAVYGFEPVHRIFEKYRENCLLNGFDIHCIEAGVSNSDGVATIFDPGGHVTALTLDKNFSPGFKYVETKVRTVTLASFIQNNQIERIDLMKIDIEGLEPEALEGMGSYLQLMSPTCLIEVTSDENAERVERFFSNMNYVYFDIDEKTPPQLVSHLRKSSKWNFLVCPQEVAKKLGLPVTNL